MIGEHFPEFLPVDARIIVPFVVAFWLGYEWPQKYFKRLGMICRVVALAFPVLYFVLYLEKILDGIVGLAEFYLPHFNSYYDSNFYLGVASEKGNSVFAFTAICMLFWGLSWTIAYGWKSKVLLVLFPVMALVLELVVGISPGGNGLFYAFFGAMLLLSMGNASILKRFLAIACVGLTIVLSGIIFEDELYEPVIREHKQAILKWQNSIDLEKINLASLFQFDFHYDWEKLNNSSPQYTGKTILEIEIDKKPNDTIYLKGFYGTNYENGDWRYDDSVFQQACKEAGKSPEEVAKLILQMPYERVVEAKLRILNSLNVNCQISYVGATGNVAYVPYVSDYNSMDDAYTLVGDFLLKKSIFDIYSSASRNYVKYQYVGNWNAINTAIEVGFGNHKYPSSYVDSSWFTINLSDQKEELDFLNSLSQAYLQLPEERDYLTKAVQTIERNLYFEEVEPYDDVYVRNENYRRMRYAQEVEKYLESQMSYSLKLDTLPADMDPIEYALTVSHEGYCMHFASAATLLLRELGVPARYVSGYTVDSSAFIEDTETGMYKAEVGDFMAHAWVEVYLDNIGWTILEATPGSSLDTLPTQADIDRWETISEVKRDQYDQPEQGSESEETENTEKPTESTEDTEETEDTQTESESSQNTQQETPTQSEEEDTNNPGGAGNGGNQNTSLETMLKAFGIIGIVVILILSVAFAIKYGVNRYNRALLDELEKQMSKKAVKRINRRMYRRILLCNPKLLFGRKLSDREYEAALIEQYPVLSEDVWKKYMDIVKKNYYSKEKITVEEMQFCFECYTKCKEKK